MPDLAAQREFWAAVGAGNSARVRELVAAGAEVNLPMGGPGGETPLIRAVTAGDLAMVRLLLELGADVNLRWKGPKSWTPLMFAHDNPEILGALIGAGADLNAQATPDWVRVPSGRVTPRPGGQTALHLAAAEGNAKAVRTLLRAGAQVEPKAEDGCAPLDYAVRLGAVTETAEALVEAGAQLTPQRLEAMHASAHSPDSDLINFPIPTDATTGQVLTKSTPPPVDKPDKPPAQETVKAREYRCPNCHALIYSRKPKICGQCGASLPPELLLTDLQAQTLADRRNWARELASKFGTQHSSTMQPAAPSLSQATLSGTLGGSISPETLLRRVSCIEEFRHRARPTFAFYVVGYAITFFAMTFLPFKFKLLPPEILLLMTAAFALLCFRAWHYASPICPNCKQNIRICALAHCHVCGQSLRNQRCEGCDVDNSWTSIFRPYSNKGNFRWITFCPGCGVRVDAKVARWRVAQRLDI